MQELLWTTSGASLRGLTLARESSNLLLWDSSPRLVLLDLRGNILAERSATETVTVGCSSDDGSRYAAGIRSGRVWLFDSELKTRWEKKPEGRPLALALETYGNYLAVADSSSNLEVFDRKGRTVWKVRTQSPLHQLRFVAEHPMLVGCAERGLVVCYDWEGNPLWRDAPFASLESLAVSGDGSLISLAGYSEGVLEYDQGGRRITRFSTVSSCRRICLSYDGRTRVTEDLVHQTNLSTDKGVTLGTFSSEAPLAGLVLNPLGDFFVVATNDGEVTKVERKRKVPREQTK